MTALHIAVHHRHTAVVKEIVKGKDKEVLNARDHVSFIHYQVYIHVYGTHVSLGEHHIIINTCC